MGFLHKGTNLGRPQLIKLHFLSGLWCNTLSMIARNRGPGRSPFQNIILNHYPSEYTIRLSNFQWKKNTHLQHCLDKLQFHPPNEWRTLPANAQENRLSQGSSWKAGKRFFNTKLTLEERILDAWRLQTASNSLKPRLKFRQVKFLRDDKIT